MEDIPVIYIFERKRIIGGKLKCIFKLRIGVIAESFT